MSISMYQASVPVFNNFLTNLRVILDYAEAHFADKHVDETTILGMRFHPDMFPFNLQIRQATHHAVHCTATLAGVSAPQIPEDYASFKGLNARIDKTLEFLATLKSDQIDDTEDKDVEYVVAGTPRAFKGQKLLLGHCIPNFFFHVTTAYDLLRQNGVELGKRHFMGYTKPGDQTDLKI